MADASKPRMFIVEDDPTWVTMLTSRYNKKFEVSAYGSAEAAIAVVEQKPDVVVLDYHLEGTLTGLDALKQIKQRSPASYVVMFSAQEDVQIALDILECGAYDYVVKREGAHERLNIILRNILNEQKLGNQVIELRLSIQRWKAALVAVVVAILLLILVIYLNICPYQRALKWDPFGRANSEECRVTNPIGN